jgi:hypothetical protein
MAWQPLDRLERFRLITGNGPLMDDSYIFFKISKDLAAWFADCAPSFQLTSGFQPLIAFLYTPFFQLFWNNRELPIHLALSLNALLGFAATILLYRLLKSVAGRSIAAFLVSVWIWSPYVMYQSINGMETTLALLMVLIVISYYWQIIERAPGEVRPWCILGLILGIGFWTRVDIAMLGVAIALDQLWLGISSDRHILLLRVRNILLCALTALLVALPWIAFTISDTGAILPISGRAVRLVTGVLFDFRHPGHRDFISLMYMYFKKELFAFQPLAALTHYGFWPIFITALSLAGLLLALQNKRLRGLLRPLWIFQAILVLSYILFIGGFWHLNRYLYPVFTLLLFLHAATLVYAQSKLRLQALPAGITLCIIFSAYMFSYAAQYRFQWSIQLPARYLSASLFARARVPQGVKVGTFQSGCHSYWLDNRVVNLDGVVNRDAYFSLYEKTMDDYLQREGIDYLVEEVFLFKMWDEYLGGQLSRSYDMVDMRVEKKLGEANSRLGIYKRKGREEKQILNPKHEVKQILNPKSQIPNNVKIQISNAQSPG